MTDAGTRFVAGVCGLLALCGPVSGGTYYVDQRHSQASDNNPGTMEEPWKTFRHAAETAKAGDTVRIRPGLYREGNITLKNSGELLKETPPGFYSYLMRLPMEKRMMSYITFEADGTQPVVLDGSVEIPPESWTPVEGQPHVYVAPVHSHGYPTSDGSEGAPMQIVWVFRNDQPLQPKISEAAQTGGDSAQRYKPQLAMPAAPDAWQWYHDVKQGLLYLNFGETNPAEGGRIEAAVFRTCIYGGYNEYIALKGLTIQRYNGRTLAFESGIGCVIEDCLVRHSGSEEAITGSAHGVVRRNTIIDADGIAIAPGSYSMVDENLVIRNFRDMLQTGNIYFATAITYFGREFVRLRNNVVLEGGGGGFWPDCLSNGHVHYGNSVGYTRGDGFYIECPAFQNVVMYNVCFHNGGAGIALRGNLHNTVSENYVFGSRSGIELRHADQYSWVRDNLFVGNWFRDVQFGIEVGNAPGGLPQTLNLSDRNVFDPSVKTVAYWEGKPYRTLPEFRQATGNELHGRLEKVNEEEMGLVSFRVAESARPWEPVLMFGNPNFTLQRLQWGQMEVPYFWIFGTADGNESLRWQGRYNGETGMTPVAEVGGFLRVSAVETDWMGYLVSASAEEDRKIKERQKGQGDSAVLEVASKPGKAISERGLGCWSVSLPSAPGSVIDLRLHAQAREIKPAAAGGGVVVFVEWSDYTRRCVQREYLVGRDEQGQDHMRDKVGGTYDYAPIAGAVTAPDWARRFRLFFGLRSCSGVVLFDEIDTVRARPGEPAPLPEESVEAVQPKPLVDPAALEFYSVDLSKVEIPIIGGRHILDWSAGRQARFTGKEEGAR